MDQARAELEAWKTLPFKACSLDAMFPSLAEASPTPPPGFSPPPPPPTGWDAAALRAAYGPNLVLRDETAPDRWAIFAGFAAGALHGQALHQSRNRHGNEGDFEADVAFEDGRCQVKLGGETVADVALYGTALVGASVGTTRAFGQTFDAPEVDLIQRPAGTPEQSWFAIPRVAAGHHFVDLAAFPGALAESLMPTSGSESSAYVGNVASILGMEPARIGSALAASSVLYEDLFVPEGALPNIVTKATGGGSYRAAYVLRDTELASFDAATRIRLEWVYARDAAPAAVARFEVVLARRPVAGRSFEIASVRALGDVSPAPTAAAVCVADAVERSLTALAPDALVGATPGMAEAEGACSALGRPYAAALASDVTSSGRVLALVTDGTRAGYAHTEPSFVAPNDGGASYSTPWSSDVLEPLFVELAQTEAGLVGLEALDSRIARGFAASVRALSARTFAPSVKRALLEAAATRAFAAARQRYDVSEDYTPLDADDVTRIAAVVGTGNIAETFENEITAKIRLGEDFTHDAAIECALRGTLDPLRERLVALESSTAAAQKTWVWNVYRSMLRWGSLPSEVLPSDPLYCNAAFFEWAEAHAGAERPSCVYMGTRFDGNDYCE